MAGQPEREHADQAIAEHTAQVVHQQLEWHHDFILQERIARALRARDVQRGWRASAAVECGAMRLRQLNVGCFGGGTGLPSLLGGLKANPWLNLHAVVTMFDSGGSSGQLHDELGVLPPGDVLKCALALAPNEAEARRVLLSRLPAMNHARLAGHTGGNLLLSMMERYSGDFLVAVDGLRALLGCTGCVWPVSVEAATLCAEYGDGAQTRGEVEVDADKPAALGQRIWLEPAVRIHPASTRPSARSMPWSSVPAASSRVSCQSSGWKECAMPWVR